MINDISQGNVATRFKCGGTADYCFIANLLLTLLWVNF